MDPEQDNIELGRYLEVLTRWWWLLLIAPVIVGALAYYLTARAIPMYRASTEVLVQQARSGLIGPGDLRTNEELANTYARLATTHILRSRVQEELSLSRTPSISASGGRSIIRISAEDPSPETARNVANKLAEVLILDIQSSQLLEIGRLEALAKSQGISVSREILQAQLGTIGSLRIIEPALTPGAPFAPKPKRNTVFGVILGLVLGGVIALLIEYLNNNIRSMEQIEKLSGTAQVSSSNIGVIFRWNPKEVGDSTLVVRDHPTSAYAEMFRQLRTGLQFVRAVHDSKAFLITSSVPLEGKTTITSNLAVVLAQGGSQVILVDADLRRPSIQRVFDLPGTYSENGYQGLSGLLVDSKRPVSQELVDVGVPGLKVMTSGRVPPNPADLLASDRGKAIFAQLKEQCDILLVDSPPVMVAADPTILAGYVDGVIMTVTMGETRTDSLQDAVSQIQRPGTPLIGFVLNKVKSRRLGYGRYHYHYYYYYPRRDEVELTNGARQRGRRRRHRTNEMVSLISRAVGRVKNPSMVSFLSRAVDRVKNPSRRRG